MCGSGVMRGTDWRQLHSGVREAGGQTHCGLQHATCTSARALSPLLMEIVNLRARKVHVTPHIVLLTRHVRHVKPVKLAIKPQLYWGALQEVVREGKMSLIPVRARAVLAAGDEENGGVDWHQMADDRHYTSRAVSKTPRFQLET
ncbi:hypothetical protein BaRGS_00024817 [Batillaria attramentaria]|uniref:Uncharacterized protein n=1 Tax=Batillaria attramentaria TaxID=370345 RepID=A0ABD0KA22_9CAEN